MWGDPTDIPLEDSKLKRKLNTPGQIFKDNIALLLIKKNCTSQFKVRIDIMRIRKLVTFFQVFFESLSNPSRSFK
jgi:hypothetical protein